MKATVDSQCFIRRSFEEALASIKKETLLCLWAPRYSGRTTLLRYAREKINSMPGHLAVYMVPRGNLDPSDRGALFSSIGRTIQSEFWLAAGKEGTNNVDLDVDWPRPDSLAVFLSSFLNATRLARLVVLLDDADQLLSTSLIILTRTLRDFLSRQHSRDEYRLLNRVTFVLAGAVSFRNLKLLEEDDLSPFDDLAPIHLPDLSEREIQAYVVSRFATANIAIDPSAVESLRDLAGGDINRLDIFIGELVQSPSTGTIGADDVIRLSDKLLDIYRSDSSIAYMISVISHDPRCLDVLDRLSSGKAQVVKSHLPPDHGRYFGMTNPELSGGFVLERTEAGAAVAWRFRNRFVEMVLRRHFTPKAIIRSYLDLGDPNMAKRSAQDLIRDLAEKFQANIYAFDEEALRYVIEANWDYRATRDRVVLGFDLLKKVLDQVFAFEEVVLYEFSPTERKLLANTSLPSPPFSSADSIELPPDGAPSQIREVRVFRSGQYTVEMDRGDYLKIVIPLKEFDGNTTALLSIRRKEFPEPWATLFVRIPIVERSVNLIWQRISQVEGDEHDLLANLGKRPGGAADAKGIPVFVATKVGTELHRHLQRNLRRFPNALEAEFLDGPAVILRDLLRMMQARDPLCVFDVSQINANVLFEFGLAVGMNRPGFLLLEQGSKPERAIPELIQDQLSVKYAVSRVLGEKFLRQVRDCWLLYQQRRAEANVIHLLGESIAPEARATPTVVVVDHDRYSDLREFRHLVEEEAAHRSLQVDYIWDERGSLINDPRYTSDTTLTRAYRAVRSAQLVIARIEKGEDNALETSRFVVTGIAKGLERTNSRPIVMLCCRQQSPEGAAVEVPSDLTGLARTYFDSKRGKGFRRDLARFFASVAGDK